MPKVRMQDTTAHADYGQLLKGEVYEVSEEHATHFKNSGLARTAHADSQTYHERRALEAEETAAPETAEEGSPTNPDIARQVEEAGTRPGDQSGTQTPGQRQPLTPPPDNRMVRRGRERA